MNLRPKPAIGGLNLPGSFPSMSSSCWHPTHNNRTPAEPADDQYLFQVGDVLGNIFPGFKRVRHRKNISNEPCSNLLVANSLKSILKVWMNLYQNPHRSPYILMNFDTHFCINFDHQNAEMCCVCRGSGFQFHGGSCYLWSARVVGGSSDSVLVDTLRRERSHIHTWGPFKGREDDFPMGGYPERNNEAILESILRKLQEFLGSRSVFGSSK